MIPKELLYSQSHEWARIEGGEAVVGITHFAQEQLGDLTFVELPAVGASVEAGKEMGSVESVKAASELYAPVSGKVVAVNEELAASPELVNQDPYGKGWMIRIELSSQPQGLLDADAYAQVAVGH
ncbi:glycine cleavage system protein GcvH [Desulfocurvibacter africanus]|uniref:Glycine cleavage system H protein n=2 Tax=Desulfocurvibacter africanus TaxID=873 RepID=F3Z008_DESAF|nr:glycine cleavage system protein GcvH [Desulfocurvibacter africanus]EGJ52037.1 Glycine cleavage system H protein [Desulfocurvibacter africanus subsp. africanus str. Walvis Bay]EMG38381.1 glycine cleavage system H protein [Desulfocurvibacter africanus PCS]